MRSMKLANLKIVITDKHVGTQKWQYAVLKKLGLNVFIASFSGHTRYLKSEKQLQSFLFRWIHILPRPIVRLVFLMNPDTRNITHILVSFPPLHVRHMEKLPEHVRVILNIGHRIHIHCREDLHKLNAYFQELLQNPRFTLCSMSEYDHEYFKYYVGRYPPYFAPVASFHLSQISTILEDPPLPRNMSNVILIGPAHNIDRMIPEIEVSKLNMLSAIKAEKLGKSPYRFEFIKQLYDDAEPVKLQAHPAVVVIPYSAFSISMIELYHLNIPFFVPSNELLLGKMNDVRLTPIYASKKTVHDMEKHYFQSSIPSPNSDTYLSQRHWMSHMFFNNVNNAIRFETIDDLLNKVYSIDLGMHSRKMRMENEVFHKNQLNNWLDIIGSSENDRL